MEHTHDVTTVLTPEGYHAECSCGWNATDPDREHLSLAVEFHEFHEADSWAQPCGQCQHLLSEHTMTIHNGGGPAECGVLDCECTLWRPRADDPAAELESRTRREAAS